VVVTQEADCHAARAELEGILRQRFGLEHTTLQVEHQAPTKLLAIEELGEAEPSS
jgi:cobalt-zinc-cadmium efflux system protein